ncbi:helix-turn-helix transcriptional regulator [Chryseobacterium gambrini]|uniref:Helix-turn-helix transcriptional regulator n=1 Tax=Chryseobacterium gambrini TaxID=373672 RepID=A0AAJ1R167_9FLAO|nr:MULTISPECIES: helix-turn-helix transcriptional regulator [Chryseobacterium]MDN4011005.1 helix-turn-helix transcriptional regulator [Chryseobacterium gambrini]MDN4028383.1 helix-turn-helix transcriptional regulator [Chryseobacterium gambrini]
MEKINHYKSITELHEKSGFEMPKHPLISLMTCKELMTYSVGEDRFTGDFYMVALKKIKSGHVLYGKTKYDHSNGSAVFMKPRQIIEVSNVQFAEKGFVMFFHEDYLSGHHLYEQIKKYGYFEYEINEALHISPGEELILWELYYKIRKEYDENPDEFSREIILSHIDSILKYSDRFYKRQFIDRSINVSGTMVKKFQKVVDNYFEKDLHLKDGLPTVNYLADKLSVSTRYLSDVLKQETGKTALEHIHIYLIKEAKNLLLSSENNVSGIAYDLGFESPSYFTRLFKKIVGLTPVQYRENVNI